MSKIDVKSDYHRTTLVTLLEATSVIKVDYLTLMIFRMTFGGSNGPFDWPGIITEPVTNLGNDLLNSNWNGKNTFASCGKIIGKNLLPTSPAFGKALPLDVVVPFSPRGKIYDFLDGIATVRYFSKSWKKLSGVSLIALHIFSRPLHSKELVPRHEMMALNKLIAEGTPSETLILLG